jgi:predicted peroxiredoxin
MLSTDEESANHKVVAKIMREHGIKSKVCKKYKATTNSKHNLPVPKYKALGFSQDFYDVHAAEIILHRAAKKHFDELGMKKLPSINQLKQEYAKLGAEKKKLYATYKAAKQKNIALGTAKANADVMLFGTRTPPQITQNRDAR